MLKLMLNIQFVNEDKVNLDLGMGAKESIIIRFTESDNEKRHNIVRADNSSYDIRQKIEQLRHKIIFNVT